MVAVAFAAGSGILAGCTSGSSTPPNPAPTTTTGTGTSGSSGNGGDTNGGGSGGSGGGSRGSFNGAGQLSDNFSGQWPSFFETVVNNSTTTTYVVDVKVTDCTNPGSPVSPSQGTTQLQVLPNGGQQTASADFVNDANNHTVCVDVTDDASGSMIFHHKGTYKGTLTGPTTTTSSSPTSPSGSGST
jgi:hypothetical protein